MKCSAVVLCFLVPSVHVVLLCQLQQLLNVRLLLYVLLWIPVLQQGLRAVVLWCERCAGIEIVLCRALVDHAISCGPGTRVDTAAYMCLCPSPCYEYERSGQYTRDDQQVPA
jgi:hypothetical protein